MKFANEVLNETLIIRVKDTTFDARGVKQFKRDMFLAISESDFKNIIVNLENVRMVDSTGLGGLLFAKRQTDIRGGRCYLVNPKSRIVSLLKISKLENIFDVVDTEQAALEAIA